VKYFAPFRIDPVERTLWRDDVRLALTHKAFELLRVLVDRAGHVVSKEALIELVWPDTHVHPDNVKVLVGEIRRALGDDPVRPRFIRSIVKRGYVFIAPVVEAPVDLSTTPLLPIFVGRNSEMDRLTEAFDAASESDRRLVFVTGESGIGKTALCEAFLRIAVTRHAMRATWTQCINVAGPSEPYYPLLDALTRLARSAGDDLVASVLARHAPSWIPHLPVLAGESWRALPAGARVASSARMLREIVTALDALAEHMTLVLWIEDLHWADPATIDVLTSLGQRRDPTRLLVLATLRPPESIPTAGALRRAHADLIAHGRAAEVRLTPLAPDDVNRYLDLRFGSETASRATRVLARSTNGHPLFLVTAVDHLVRKGHLREDREGWRLAMSLDALEAAIPASLAGTVNSELAELTPDERHAIEAASIVGVEFSLWLAAHAAEVDELALEPILEMLARRKTFIVREGVIELANGMFSPLYRFKHSLYQEIVFENTAAATRTETHSRAGLAMERLFAGREREVAADLACHFHGAGDHRRAARYLRFAASNALRRYAPREAAALLHGAVKHVGHLPADERTELELPLMLELGQAEFAAGEAGLATLTWTRLERRAQEVHRPNERLRAMMALAEAHTGASRDEALGYGRKLSELIPAATDTDLAATAAIRAGIIELQFGEWSDQIADGSLDAWRSLSKTGSDEQRSLAIRLLLIQILRSGYSGAWTAGRKLLPSALRSGNLNDCIYCYFLLGFAALHLGRWGEALEMASEGAAIADKAGSTRYAASMRLLEAWVAIEGQRWDEAQRLSLAQRPLIESCGWTNALQFSLLFGGAAALGLGNLEEASADLERLRDWYARERIVLDWFWEIQLHIYLAELALRRKDLERATSEAKAAQEAAGATPERTWRARANVTAAQVAIERQAYAEADRYLRQARREIRGIEAPLASWRVEAVTATLLELTAQPDSARRARMRYERTLNRLERSIVRPTLPIAARGEQIH
jgi:predicted ATPase/DNA-binding winged helix-turn-helix (wHTH) protein